MGGGRNGRTSPLDCFTVNRPRHGKKRPRGKRPQIIQVIMPSPPIVPSQADKSVWILLWQAISRPVRWIIGIAIAIGALIGLYYQAMPSIKITSLDARSPNDPFSIPFTVSNEGWIPALDVSYGCEVFDATFESPNMIIKNPHMSYKLDRKDNALWYGDTETIDCSIRVGTGDPPKRHQIKMAINVCYQIPLLSTSSKQTHFFNGQIDSAGKYHFDPILRPPSYSQGPFASIPMPGVFSC